MKLTVQHVHVRSDDELDTLVEERILALEPLLLIEEAKVRLECSWQESPAFRVGIHLVTPGPDVEAEGRDHTLRAAIEKGIAELEEKIEARSRKGLWRRQSKVRGRHVLSTLPNRR